MIEQPQLCEMTEELSRIERVPVGFERECMGQLLVTLLPRDQLDEAGQVGLRQPGEVDPFGSGSMQAGECAVRLVTGLDLVRAVHRDDHESPPRLRGEDMTKQREARLVR